MADLFLNNDSDASRRLQETLRSRPLNKSGTPQACDACRAEHSRCPRGGPCARCVRKGRECTFARVLLKAGPPSNKERKQFEAAGITYTTFRARLRAKRQDRLRMATEYAHKLSKASTPAPETIAPPLPLGPPPEELRHSSFAFLELPKAMESNQASSSMSSANAQTAALAESLLCLPPWSSDTSSAISSSESPGSSSDVSSWSDTSPFGSPQAAFFPNFKNFTAPSDLTLSSFPPCSNLPLLAETELHPVFADLSFQTLASDIPNASCLDDLAAQSSTMPFFFEKRDHLQQLDARLLCGAPAAQFSHLTF